MNVTDVSIIAGGWSVANVDLAAVPGTIIAVNDAAIRTRCHIALSMDRLWTEYRWPQVHVGLRVGNIQQAWIRRAAAKNIDRTHSKLKLFECEHKSSIFSNVHGQLNGTNSGMCAFNLAFLYKPERIWLFGFDMNRSPKGEAYWYSPYPWSHAKGATTGGKYNEWAKQFAAAANLCQIAGIKVFNVSPTSAIDVFPKIHPKDLPKAAEQAA